MFLELAADDERSRRQGHRGAADRGAGADGDRVGAGREGLQEDDLADREHGAGRRAGLGEALAGLAQVLLGAGDRTGAVLAGALAAAGALGVRAAGGAGGTRGAGGAGGTRAAGAARPTRAARPARPTRAARATGTGVRGGGLGVLQGALGGSDRVLGGLHGLAAVGHRGQRVVADRLVEGAQRGLGTRAEGAGRVGSGAVAEPGQGLLQLLHVVAGGTRLQVPVHRQPAGQREDGAPGHLQEHLARLDLVTLADGDLGDHGGARTLPARDGRGDLDGLRRGDRATHDDGVAQHALLDACDEYVQGRRAGLRGGLRGRLDHQRGGDSGGGEQDRSHRHGRHPRATPGQTGGGLGAVNLFGLFSPFRLLRLVGGSRGIGLPRVCRHPAPCPGFDDLSGVEHFCIAANPSADSFKRSFSMSWSAVFGSGSGKFATPFARMQAVSAFASASCSGVAGGTDRRLSQADSASLTLTGSALPESTIGIPESVSFMGRPFSFRHRKKSACLGSTAPLDCPDCPDCGAEAEGEADTEPGVEGEEETE